MCRVCGCYREGIIMMDVFWRFCSELGKGATSETGKSFPRAAYVL